MNKYAYQLYDIETGWTGYFIWTDKSTAEELCKEMNKDRKECGLEETLAIRTVQII